MNGPKEPLEEVDIILGNEVVLPEEERGLKAPRTPNVGRENACVEGEKCAVENRYTHEEGDDFSRLSLADQGFVRLLAEGAEKDENEVLRLLGAHNLRLPVGRELGFLVEKISKLTLEAAGLSKEGDQVIFDYGIRENRIAYHVIRLRTARDYAELSSAGRMFIDQLIKIGDEPLQGWEQFDRLKEVLAAFKVRVEDESQLIMLGSEVFQRQEREMEELRQVITGVLADHEITVKNPILVATGIETFVPGTIPTPAKIEVPTEQPKKSHLSRMWSWLTRK